jgi:Flp pilus assembly protein protease CpaA
MFNIIFVFLSVFFLIICSYSDLKTRTISNKLVFFFLTLSFIIRIIESIIQKNTLILLFVFLTFCITFIISYILWLFGVIAGGDLKILLVIALLSQQIMVFSPNISLFPFVLLLLGFLVLTPYILIYSIITILKNKQTKHFKQIISKHQFKQTILLALGIYLINSFLSIYSIHLKYLFLLILSFLLIFIFTKYVKKIQYNQSISVLLVLYVCLFLYSIFANIHIFNILSLLFLFITITIINIIISLTRITIQNVLIQKKRIKNLQEGDVLTKNVYIINKKLHFKKITFTQTIKQMIQNKYYENLKIDSRKVGGLTKEDIAFLKKACNKNLSKQVFIKKTIPFTPALLISYIILLFMW